MDASAISRHADEAGEAARQRYAHERLRIQGIHCADCADKISAVTGKMAGVTSSGPVTPPNYRTSPTTALLFSVNA